MPTYEFRCPNGHEFERFYRKISDAASELPCPECSAVAGRQLSAGAGLLFKGSGFYLTDYGKNAHRKTGSAPAGGKGDAKSESKPDSKSEGGSSGGDAKAADAKPSDKSDKSTAAPKSGGGGDKT